MSLIDFKQWSRLSIFRTHHQGTHPCRTAVNTAAAEAEAEIAAVMTAPLSRHRRGFARAVDTSAVARPDRTMSKQLNLSVDLDARDHSEETDAKAGKSDLYAKQRGKGPS
jgi:hypothetical protein